MSTVEPGFLHGDDSDQIIAILDRLAVDGGDDVAGLEAGLGGGLAGADLADDDAGFESVDASDGAGQIGLEADADGAADDLVLGAEMSWL